MPQVTIIPLKKSMTGLSQVLRNGVLCYYLTDNYERFVDLRKKFKGADIKNLSGTFNETFQELKDPFLEAFAGLNKEHSSYSWWGGVLASKSCSAMPLIHNLTYLFCAKKILSDQHKDIIFIVDSSALISCIAGMARDEGFDVVDYKSGFDKYSEDLKYLWHYFLQIGSFSLKIIRNRIVSFQVPKPILRPKPEAQKRVVIRSWFTKGGFNKSSEFEDRNFGRLPQWLRSRGYEVWVLPMFFNISAETMREAYLHLKNNDQPYLMPEHYLRLPDYVRCLYNSYRVFSRRIKGIIIKGTDVSSLFNEALKRQGFDVALCILNLSAHVLRRLKQLPFEIDGFYYAFENNAPEKQFVLSCREHYPRAKIIGFQHTAFFANQLAVHLSGDEKGYHPLPDKIVCSGLIYRNLYEKARFPKDILTDGPNLRFKAVHLYGQTEMAGKSDPAKNLLLPLTFSPDLAFELIMKVKESLESMEGYRVCIRSHPLLSKKRLEEYVRKIDMKNYVFAADGDMREWLLRTHAVVSTGGTIAVLEAICFRVPVIRVIPDNTFYYDALAVSSYPLEPVNTSLEIRQQLRFIEDIYRNGNGVLQDAAAQVLKNYFEEPNEENLKAFL